MKKMKNWLLIAATSTALTSGASMATLDNGGSGMYVHFGGGLTMVNKIEKGKLFDNSSKIGVTTNSAYEANYTMGGEASVGYAVTDNIRVELGAALSLPATYKAKQGDKDKAEDKELFQVSNNAAFLRALMDMEIGNGFNVFGGLQLGMNMKSFTNKSILKDKASDADNLVSKAQESRYGFDAAPVIGVSYDVTEMITADVSYKYQYSGSLQASEKQKVTMGGSESEINIFSDSYYTAHKIELGARINF
jgi:opacity protein-like surface antigen